jgi:hypothetical protein
MQVLALDLEGTLISNAVSQIPRPGLLHFLEECRALAPRLVLYTSVPESRVRPVIEGLISRGDAPEWLREIEVVAWAGPHKRLHFIPGVAADDVLLIDDMAQYVHPDDLHRWVSIPCFEAPYMESDSALRTTLQRIRAVIAGRS